MHKFIRQSDVKHIMMSPIKTIISVLKASTDIIINIPAPSVRLAEILAIMSVWTFKISDILYIAQNIFSIDLYNNNGKDVKIP